MDRALGDWIPKSDFPPLRDAGGQDSRLTRTLKKKIALLFNAIGNVRLLLFKHWKIFINDSFDMFKVQTKKRI